MTILGVVISLKTRTDGLLSLESESSGAKLDPFIKKWLQHL
jgi:flagellar motor component MotA